MPRLDDNAKVADHCRVMAQVILRQLDKAYAARKDDRCFIFSSAWDGLFASSDVDICMHRYDWDLLRSISEDELVKLLLEDCARALTVRTELEAKQAVADGKLH